MKDQYFGDVNDFRKYGLLRAIATASLRSLGICWMLTPADGRTDGRHLGYLKQPKKYRRFDPELFDWLVDVVDRENDRRTARIESTFLLGSAVFHSALVPDNPGDRQRWLAQCSNAFRDCDLVFFDPDNGLERSIAYGRRNSCKFLYWTEVRDAFNSGASVLVYQHFPREIRQSFIARLASRLKAETGADAAFSFRTPHVVFLLTAQERHLAAFRAVVEVLAKVWPDTEIAACEH